MIRHKLPGGLPCDRVTTLTLTRSLLQGCRLISMSISINLHITFTSPCSQTCILDKNFKKVSLTQCNYIQIQYSEHDT